jgi:hypothetical protein
MPRGGERPNAGRPIKYDYTFRLALANEVGLLKARNPRWKNGKILDELVRIGKRHAEDRTQLPRLLESRYNIIDFDGENIDLRDLLTRADREGILQALPELPTKK